MRWFFSTLSDVSHVIAEYFFFKKRTRKFYVLWVVIGGVLVSLFSSIIFAIWIDFSQVRKLKNYTPSIPSKIFDRKGRLITTFFTDHRIMIDSSQIPPTVPMAFIAIEDNHFYDHPGIDISAILRAFLKNTFSRGIKQGGSTITQQLAKVILTDRRRTYTRKIKEAIISLYLDYLFDKKEILNMYFNQIYFGHGNYGIEAASQFYFTKSVSDLSIGESAVLAALPSAPNRYSPIRNPHLSRQKVLLVLLKMVDNGFITLDTAKKEYAELMDYYASLNISPNESAFGRRTDHAPYFTEHIRKKLEKELGRKMLYEKGLQIYTSLDLDHQKAAQKALWFYLKEQNKKSSRKVFNQQMEFSEKYSDSALIIQSLFGIPEYKTKQTRDEYEMELYFHANLTDDLEILTFGIGGDGKINANIDRARANNPYAQYFVQVQGAIVEIDHATGEITAMVGGTPFNATNQINRSIQMKRQPGSTFKPILYASAIELNKITAATIFPDTPLIFLDIEGDHWIPENYSGGYRGFITVRQALRYSTNMVSIAIARESGLNSLLPIIARQLHVDTSQVPPNLSVALGSYEVSPLQLARSFSLFPRGGKDLNVFTISRILDADGNVIKENKPQEEKQLLKKSTASLMVNLLQDVVNKGTGRGVRRNYHGFAGGKTGTTNNYRDAWFVGFNRRYTSAVWIGYDNPTMSLGPGQAGGAIAAPTWGYFRHLVREYEKDDKPHLVQSGLVSVEVCESTGKLPSPVCQNIIREIFIPGTQPTEIGDDSLFKASEESQKIDTIETEIDNSETNLEDDAY